MKTISRILTTCLMLISMMNVKAQDKIISLDQIPVTAKNLVKEYFSDLEVSYVKEEVEYLMIKEYVVKFKNGEEIEFDKKGEWKEIDMKKGEVPSAIIPTQILNYIQKSFPDTHIMEIKKNTRNYEVEISNGLELKFNRNGEFLKIDD